MNSTAVPTEQEFSRLSHAQRRFEAKEPDGEEQLREAIAATRKKLGD
jgi:hypothetical protein